MKKKLINRENYTEAMGQNLYENWKLKVRYSDHAPVNVRFFNELCIEASHVRENCDFIRTVMFPAEFALIAGCISLFQTERGLEMLAKTCIDPIILMGIIIVIAVVILLLFCYREISSEHELELLKELYINGIKENKYCPNTENVSIIIEEHTELRGKKEKSKKKHKKNKRK